METLIRGSDFIFDCVIYCITDADGKCFQYTPTVASIHKGIWKKSQKISKSKPFRNKIYK